MAEKNHYQIIITKPARDRFQNEILSYIKKNFNRLRAVAVKNKLEKLLVTLQIDPQRGSVEQALASKGRIFRFILLKETKFFELKIIFFIDQLENKVTVIDFFPTKMNPSKMRFLS